MRSLRCFGDDVISVQCVMVDFLLLLRTEVSAVVNIPYCNHAAVCGVLRVCLSLVVAHPQVGAADVGV